jgi:hypothetical protein
LNSFQWASLFKDKLIERLRDPETRSVSVRAAALAIVEPLADDPDFLDYKSWDSVQTPDGRLDGSQLEALRSQMEDPEASKDPALAQ